MGEYAVRKIDKKTVKIGTCSRMYYMTLGQIKDVIFDSGFEEYLGNLIFRPFLPSEEGIKVGDFKDFNVDFNETRIFVDSEKAKEELNDLCLKVPGIVQVPVKSNNIDAGIHLNVRCYHGAFVKDLEEIKNDFVRIFYNGFNSNVFHISRVGIKDKNIQIYFSCGLCGKTFCMDYDEFLNDWFCYGDYKKYLNNKIYDLQNVKGDLNKEFYNKIIDFSKLKRL